MWLLLAVTPLVCTLLASESAEKSDAAPVMSSDSHAKSAPVTPKDSPATVAPAPAAPSPAPAATPSSSANVKSRHPGGASSLKAWFMLW
jgi:predicted component of type VI protein secretion system